MGGDQCDWGSADPQAPNVLTLLMTAENRSEATRTLAARLSLVTVIPLLVL